MWLNADVEKIDSVAQELEQTKQLGLAQEMCAFHHKHTWVNHVHQRILNRIYSSPGYSGPHANISVDNINVEVEVD